jgi:hypothetical protein
MDIRGSEEGEFEREMWFILYISSIGVLEFVVAFLSKSNVMILPKRLPLMCCVAPPCLQFGMDIELSLVSRGWK